MQNGKSTSSRIIMASKSPYRAQMLSGAGVAFDQEASGVDEREIEKPLQGAELDGADIAEVLAQAKADAVSSRNPSAVVIGCDQTLSLAGELLHKPANMEEARTRLLQLSGKSHQLNSAVALVKDGQLIWSHVDQATITFRDLDPGFVGRHLASVGEKALTSVGAYQIEGEGVQLFKSIRGDFFTIMGLPLLPLLEELRNQGLIDG